FVIYRFERPISLGPCDDGCRQFMQAKPQSSKWLETAREAMEIEAEAIRAAGRRLDDNLERAVDMILAHPGKVVVTGLGKSGHVARKIVATMCSTGTPAVFLHA